MELADWKLLVKEADDSLCRELFAWMTVAAEVRGIIPIAGAAPARKRRSDAGVLRTQNGKTESSLSGFPDEPMVGE